MFWDSRGMKNDVPVHPRSRRFLLRQPVKRRAHMVNNRLTAKRLSRIIESVRLAECGQLICACPACAFPSVKPFRIGPAPGHVRLAHESMAGEFWRNAKHLRS